MKYTTTEEKEKKETDRLLQCRLFLLDMDGTLYLGDEVLDGAIRFVEMLKESGRDYIYLTNNSSRAGEDYIARLRKLGFPCERENIFTSGMATGMYLRQHYPGKAVCVVGTKAFREELKRYHVRLAEKEAEVVCVGFDTELTYHALECAVDCLTNGAEFIAANPDFVCPMPGKKVLPDCGSICALLTAATGKKPFYIGKPNRNMVDILSAMRGIPNERICCVGDRLYTDIAVAKHAGAVSVLVLSGETTKEMAAASPFHADYIFSDVGELSKRMEESK